MIKPCMVAVFGILVALSRPVSAQMLVQAGSEIAFTVRQMGVAVDGRFRNFSAQLAFDPKRLQDATVGFTIDLASISFGAAETEVEVAKPAWLDTRRFPQATFRSTAVKAAGPGSYQVTGRLSIKGVVREIMVPVTLAQAGAESAAAGSFVLKRLDFNVGDGEWRDFSLVADDVHVRFRLVLSGLQKP